MQAHLKGIHDGVVDGADLAKAQPDWGKFLASGLDLAQSELIRLHERSGRPAGSEEFISKMESLSGRVLRVQKPGPKPRRKCFN